MEAKNLKLGYQTKKMAPKMEGPFEITEVLSPYHENNVHGPNFIQPPPDLVEGEEEYEIESIMGHKK